MKQFTIFAAFMFVAIFAVSASAQGTTEAPKRKAEEPKKDDTKKAESALLTKWDVIISAPGQDYPGVLKIEKAGEKLTGSVTTELGEAPLGGIKIDGDSFTATVVVNAMGQIIEGTMSGRAKDGKITGEMVLNGLGTIPYAGKKP